MADAMAYKKPKRVRYGQYWAMNYYAGSTYLLGDLGGASGTAQHNIFDLDFKSTRVMTGFGYQIRPTKVYSLRFDMYYARLSGNDAYSENEARRLRNVHVNTNVYELAVLNEINVGKVEKKFIYPGVKNKVFGGVSGIYFNPKANYAGENYALHSLGTEGQRTSPRLDPYSKFSVNLILGTGLYYYWDRYHSIGVEISGRKSFTDYLDDTSTEYYDNDLLRADQGNAAADLADPNLTGTKRAAGSKRGDSGYNDNYFFVNFSYRITLGKSKNLF